MEDAAILSAPDLEHWDDSLLVGHPHMDDTHREFVQLVNRLSNCQEGDAMGNVDMLIAHLSLHFGLEKDVMEKTGFPATDCHQEEHDKVLKTAHEVKARLQDNRMSAKDIRRLAKALRDWFPAHSAYMDSALANWVSKKTHGGAPIVIRRRATEPSPT